MTVTTRTWRHSALYTNATFTVAGVLAAVNTAVLAEVAAFPSTALWTVADYSAVNGTITFKRTAVSSGGAGRIMLFGGSVPHTLAADGSSLLNTSLYGGYAVSATSDAPEQAYTAGKPYTTGDWLPGGQIILTATIANIERVEWYEHEEGMFFVFRLAIMNTTNAISSFFGGFHGVSVDGSTAYAIACGSAGQWATTQDTATAGAGSQWLSLGTEATAGNTRTNFQESAGNVRRCRKLQVVPATAIQDALRDSGSKRYFYPIYLRNSDETRLVIKMRQIGIGITEVHNQTMNTATLTPACIKISTRSDQNDNGPWLTNFLT
jgi:hypothetical protein